MVYYPPGLLDASHRHPGPAVGFLLAGGFEETSEGRSHNPVGQQVGVLPAGHEHEVRFGRDGALMLSIDCPSDTRFVSNRRMWRKAGPQTARRIALIGAGGVWNFDLVAELGDTAECHEGANEDRVRPGPAWLDRALDQIAETPDVPIVELAREGGVSRSHLARIFQRHLGVTPTECRLIYKSSAAVRHMMEGRLSLAEAALAAGFADQSHWTRACRALAGQSPGRLRRLLQS